MPRRIADMTVPHDRHAPVAALHPADRAAASRVRYDPDPDVEQYPCCTAEQDGHGGWQHSRSCPFRRRTA